MADSSSGSGSGGDTGPRLPVEILLMIIEASTHVFGDEQLWFDLARVSRLFRETVEQHIMSRGPKDALYTLLESDVDRGLIWCRFLPGPLRYDEREDGGSGKGRDAAGRCSLNCTNVSYENIGVVFDRFDPADRYMALFKERRLRSLAELRRMEEHIKHEQKSSEAAAAAGEATWMPAAPAVQVVRYWVPRWYENYCNGQMLDLGPPLKISVEPEANGKGRLVLGYDWRRIWTVKCAPLRWSSDPSNSRLAPEGEAEAATDAGQRSSRSLGSRISRWMRSRAA